MVAQLAEPQGGRIQRGAQGRIRTTDTRIFSPLLYQLSYLGLWGVPEARPAEAGAGEGLGL